MTRVLKRVFQILGVDQSTETGSDSDLATALEAARLMSFQDMRQDTIVVVVEMGSEFDLHAGAYLRRQYLYYPFREATDYRRIVCLKAAFWNGRRIDTEPAEFDIDCDLVPVGGAWGRAETRLTGRTDGTDRPTLVWGRRGQWRGPKERTRMQSR